MKKITLLVAFALTLSLFACNSGTEGKSSSGDASHSVTKFLEDFSSLEDIEGTNPIVLFKELAEEEADKVMKLKKGNVEKVLAKAKEYKHCIITLEDHTIVKVIDLDDCQKSGSWAACMPRVKGYVKKGKLIAKKDYMNNVIGTPDSQERRVFLFK